MIKLIGVRVSIVLLLLGTLSACSNKHHLDTFYAHRPKSILVAPILNETVDLMAAPVVMSSITRPLAERGYYVFPLYLTRLIFQDMGLVEAGHIHQLPTQRFYELFGADAVLFITIKDWSTKYLVLASYVRVEMDYVLKDTQTGVILWEATHEVEESSGGGINPVMRAVTAAINAMMTSYLPLAKRANREVFNPSEGIPVGQYHPNYKNDESDFE